MLFRVSFLICFLPFVHGGQGVRAVPSLPIQRVTQQPSVPLPSLCVTPSVWPHPSSVDCHPCTTPALVLYSMPLLFLLGLFALLALRLRLEALRLQLGGDACLLLRL